MVVFVFQGEVKAFKGIILVNPASQTRRDNNKVRRGRRRRGGRLETREGRGEGEEEEE